MYDENALWGYFNDCNTCNESIMEVIVVFLNLVPLSVRMELGTPYTAKQFLKTALATGLSRIGIVTTKLSSKVQIYFFFGMIEDLLNPCLSIGTVTYERNHPKGGYQYSSRI